MAHNQKVMNSFSLNNAIFLSLDLIINTPLRSDTFQSTVGTTIHTAYSCQVSRFSTPTTRTEIRIPFVIVIEGHPFATDEERLTFLKRIALYFLYNVFMKFLKGFLSATFVKYLNF